jgi:hypothetical protein
VRFTYLILAHRDLDQLAALVARLLRDDPEDRVILHYDRGSPESDAALARFGEPFGPRLTLVPRIRCRWGHRSQVEAILLLLDRALDTPFDYVHLISGQDWPIRTKTELLAGLEPGALYLSFEEPPMPERMDAYHFHDRLLGPSAHATTLRYRTQLLLRRLGRAWTRLAGPRTCPFGPAWRKGSTWWSLPRPAAEHAVAGLRALIESRRLHHTLCADEHAIQTLLAYSAFAPFIRPNRRFIRWQPGRSSPDLLTAADTPALLASDAWFARKLDRAVDPFFLSL